MEADLTSRLTVRRRWDGQAQEESSFGTDVRMWPRHLLPRSGKGLRDLPVDEAQHDGMIGHQIRPALWLPPWLGGLRALRSVFAYSSSAGLKRRGGAPG